LGTAILDAQAALDTTKQQLARTINQSVADIVKNNGTSAQPADLAKITAAQNDLLSKVDSSLGTAATVTPADINNLKTEISAGINNIRSIAGGGSAPAPASGASSITSSLNTLAQTVSAQVATIKSQGGDLLYKDSNNDGISDYDSVNVYHMSPTAPSPVSVYQGKKINASEKVLLGLDPTQSKVVEVKKEQPAESPIAPVPIYKVKEVALTSDKKGVVLKGQALPNSFITLYVYSTPIMVTVKTDSKGEWQYVLDKELPDGDHTVFTATVDNSGEIIAKSSGFPFIKTAEAATLKDIPVVATSADTTKPGLMQGSNIYWIILIIGLAILAILIVIGLTSEKGKEKV
jgi:hypothetical protein